MGWRCKDCGKPVLSGSAPCPKCGKKIGIYRRTISLRCDVHDHNLFFQKWKETKLGESIPELGLEVLAAGWGDTFAERDHFKRRYEIAKKLLERAAAFDELEILERMEKFDQKKQFDRPNRT